MSLTYSLTPYNTVVRSDGLIIPNDPNNKDWASYELWLSQNNTPTPYDSPSPVSTCALWQIEAYITPSQWANALSFVAASNNANLIAFASHGSNMIPSNSTTLASLAESIGIDPSTLYNLVANASQINIP